MDDVTPCPACGTPVPRNKRGRRRIWCSDPCRLANMHRLDKARQKERRRVRKVGRTCVQCGTDISERPASALYCSARCGAMTRGEQRPEPLPEQVCALEDCGAVFQPWRVGQRCCSEKHGKLLYNRESRADGRQPPPQWDDRRRDRYHRRRALKRETSSGEPVLLADIAERDRWCCHICRGLVDQKLKWPDPMSPSLDHVVPLSEGGGHDPANVRLAHVRCNSARGNRGGGEQLLLIG